MRFIPAFLLPLLRDEKGVTAIEYGIIAAGIALALIPVMGNIFSSLLALFGLIPGWFTTV